MKKTVEITYPGTKISETFLHFAEPLLRADRLPAQEEAEAALMIAWTVWNAVVQDTVNGNDQLITMLRKQCAGKPPVAALTEQMIQRKKTLYGNDLRLIGEYKLTMRGDEWHLRAEARIPQAH